MKLFGRRWGDLTKQLSIEQENDEVIGETFYFVFDLTHKPSLLSAKNLIWQYSNISVRGESRHFNLFENKCVYL